jgi:hypothetical protein
MKSTVTVARDDDAGADQHVPKPHLLTAISTWSARLLLALIALWLLIGLAWFGQDFTFVLPGLLLLVGLVGSWKWPEVAVLSVVLLLGFGLFLFWAIHSL